MSRIRKKSPELSPLQRQAQTREGAGEIVAKLAWDWSWNDSFHEDVPEVPTPEDEEPIPLFLGRPMSSEERTLFHAVWKKPLAEVRSILTAWIDLGVP